MGCGAPTVNGVPVDEGVVVGGSGAEYASIAAGQAGEAEQSATDTTAAGTVAGTVIATVVPAWLAVGDIIVLTDVTPGNGLTCLYAVIRAIAGATLTIDKPWNFGVGEGITYVRPIILTLKRPLTESVTFTKNVIFNLAGNVLSGSIDFTGGAYHEISGGSGIVSNGITTTNLSVTILVDISYVGRRAGTNYAYIMTSGSNIGATETYNCGFGGIVSGRRGYGRWIIDDCQNDGVAETDQNCPWRPFESVVGIAVVISNADVTINSTYSGCVFYSENSITGPAAALAVRVDAVIPGPSSNSLDPSQLPTNLSLYLANGAATLTITATATSYCAMNVNAPVSTSLAGVAVGANVVSHVWLVNFTGTVSVSNTFLLNVYGPQASASPTRMANIYTQGSATTTGSATTSGTNTWNGPYSNYFTIILMSPLTGTLVMSGTAQCQYVNLVEHLLLASSLVVVNGAASITIAGLVVLKCNQFLLMQAITGSTITAGTFAFTGSFAVQAAFPTNPMFAIPAGVSGGTWTITGAIAIGTLARSASTSLVLFSTAATGGTFTISSATIRVAGMHASAFSLLTSTTAGGVITITSAAVVVMRGCKFYAASIVVDSTTATSTAAMQGSLQFEECEFGAALTLLNVTAGGGIGEIRNITFNDCVFESTFTGESGAGTRTYVGELRMRNCHCVGLVTVILGVGAAASGFTKFETWETAFEGSSGNKSIAATGVRPTVAGAYRHWRPSMKALINDLKPEVIREWSVLPNAAVISNWGALSTINAAAASIVCVAASIFEGVVLDTTAGVGGEPVIAVTDGDIFVKVDATVAAGDNLIIDPAVPAQGVLGVFTGGQNVGRALEAAGGTFAGKSYTRVCAR